MPLLDYLLHLLLARHDAGSYFTKSRTLLRIVLSEERVVGCQRIGLGDEPERCISHVLATAAVASHLNVKGDGANRFADVFGGFWLSHS
jgi:hypothetical protein